MLVYRDFVTYYKQTILGPLWFFIQPLFTAAINLFVFGSLAGLGPQGVPGFFILHVRSHFMAVLSGYFYKNSIYIYR